MTLADIRLGLREFLSDDAAVSALVDDRIYPMVLKQGEKQASIVFTKISGQGDHHMSGPSRLAQPLYQIDAWAGDPDVATDLANAIKERLDGYRGAMPYGTTSPQEEVEVLGVFFTDEREDFESEIGMYRVSRDYFIWHRE